MSEKSQKTGKKCIWVCKFKPLSFYISRTHCKNTVMKADPRPVFGPFDGGCWLSHWAARQPNFLHPRCGHRSSERQDFSRSWVRQIKSHVLIYWWSRLIYYFCIFAFIVIGYEAKWEGEREGGGVGKGLRAGTQTRDFRSAMALYVGTLPMRLTKPT